MIKEGKIWGTNILVFLDNNIQINQIYINKGGRCSKHKHSYKHNLFYIQSGKIEVEQWLDGGLIDKTILLPNETIEIKPNIYHRFTGLEDSMVLEIYRSNYINLDDIIRDDQGRLL